MNREIKFRAWHKAEKKFVPIANIHTRSDNRSFGGITETWSKKEHLSHEFTLTQFIGIVNNQGQEIYDGDIIETPFGVKNKVFWYNHRWCYANQFNASGEPITWIEFNSRDDKENKVVGNIFQHPELLKYSNDIDWNPVPKFQSQ